MNTAKYFDPLDDEHGEGDEAWMCDDIESGDDTIDDFGYEAPARKDTRDPAMVAYQESLRAEPEAESESGRTSSQPPRNGMGAHEFMMKMPTRHTYKPCQYEDFRVGEAAASAQRAQVEGRDSKDS